MKKAKLADPVPTVVESSHNVHIDGDEARILLQMMVSKDNYVACNQIDKFIILRKKLYELHINQPPEVK